MIGPICLTFTTRIPLGSNLFRPRVVAGQAAQGEAFLVWTAALYVPVLLSFALPSLSHYWSYFPVGWGVGYFFLLADIYRVTKTTPT